MFEAFQTADAVQIWAIESALNYGNRVSPRHNPTLEVSPAAFTLTNPRSRRIFNPARRWSFPLAIGEFAWHVSASDEVNPLAFYAPSWMNFSEDKLIVRGSCYGKRIFAKDVGESQWGTIVSLLKEDPDSRRAIITLQQPANESDVLRSVDVSCVTAVQFFIRERKLDALCSMRSNDIILGLPYDIFLFTMLQELLAETLGVELGRYHHVAGSLHLYEKHLEWARRIAGTRRFDSEAMPEMGDVAALPQFLECEEALRNGKAEKRELPPYWRNISDVIQEFASAKLGADRGGPPEI